MIRKGEWHLVRAMKNDGASVTAIANRYGIDRKTVRNLLGQDSWPDDDARTRVKRGSKLDPFKDYIKARLGTVDLSGVRIYEEIAQRGYSGKMTILQDFIREVKEEERVRAVVRFETIPGQQSQVDWTYAGKFVFDGVTRPVYCFLMVLGCGRGRFVTFTHSMDIHTLMRCHIEAFHYFGGHTREILYDNMKAVILRPKGPDSPAVVNPEFLDFAGYYGFTVDSCRPYRAQTKGKVERLADYVKDNFIKGREFVSLVDMKHQGIFWCDEVNGKVHGTTGKIPAEELANEGLVPLPTKDYDTSKRSTRIVSRDCLISYEGSRYEVPWRYAGRAVTVKDDDDAKLAVMKDDDVLVEHRKSDVKRQTVRIPELNRELWEKVLGQRCRIRPEEKGCSSKESSHLSLVGGQVPVVSVENRDLSYYEEVAG